MNQFLWLLIGLGTAMVVFAITFGLLGKGALIIASPFLLVGVPFAFYKKNGLTLYQYIIRKRKFEKKEKYLINQRKEVTWKW